MKRSLWQESFIPVVLVVLTIFIALLFVKYQVSHETDQAIIIDIPTIAVNSNTDVQDVNSNEEEAVDTSSADDPERAMIMELINAHSWAKAEQILQSRLTKEASSENLTYLGIFHYRKHQYDKALNILNRAIATKPIYASVYFYRGLVFTKQGELEKAMADYRHQIKLMPFHFEANYNLGVTQRKMKKYRAASQTFEHTLGLASGKRKAKTYYNLGLVLHHRGAAFKEQAKKAFNAAIRLQPSYISPRFGLASLETGDESGQHRALLQYETVLRLRPDYAPAHFRKGLTYSALHDRKAAIAAYRKAIQHNPAYFKAHYNLGLQLINNRQWDEASQQFMWILERDPTHARSHFNLGRIATGKLDYAAALKHYQKALTLREGNYPEALVNMGRILVQKGESDQAINTYNKAIQLRPGYAKAWYSKGIAQLQAGKKSEAENAFETAIQHKQNYLHAWRSLGDLYHKENRLDEAIHAYQQVLILDEDHQSAQLALADIYEQQKRYTDAVSLYESVLDSYPSYVLAKRKLAAVYMAMARYDDAEKILHQALQLDPLNIEVKRILASIMFKKQRNKEAARLRYELVESEPARADLRLEYAQVLIAMGDTNTARAELEKGLRLAPNNIGLLQAMKSLEK